MPIVASPRKWETNTSSVSGRWCLGGRPLDQRSFVAGDQPALPLDVLSHRYAYTSERAPNNDRNNPTFSAAVDERSTVARSVGSSSRVGTHTCEWPSLDRSSRPSSPRRRAISALRPSISRTNDWSVGSLSPVDTVIGEAPSPGKADRLLQAHQFGTERLVGAELKADDRVAVEGFGYAAQCVRTRTMLAALDAGNH